MNWKYALSELVIVVVGILLAVQVDRLGQRRGEAATLQEHLDNLVADLQTDSAALAEAVEYEFASMEAANQLLRWMEEGTRPDDDRLVATVNLLGGSPLVLRRGTYQTMLSTGALGSIEDVAFRNAVTNYYENFPGAVLATIVEYHSSYQVNPISALLDRHLDPRARFVPAEVASPPPLFVTTWEALAADEDLSRQLRILSAGNFAMTPAFSAVAAETGKLRSEAIRQGGRPH